MFGSSYNSEATVIPGHVRSKGDVKRAVAQAAPYLQHLTECILASVPDVANRWTSLWVGAPRGYLPGVYMQRVLANRGSQLPVTLLHSDEAVRRQYHAGTTDEQTRTNLEYDRLALNGSTVKRGLIVTDTIGLDDSASYLAMHMSQKHTGIDVLSIGEGTTEQPIRLQEHETIARLYGGVGQKALAAARSLQLDPSLFGDRTEQLDTFSDILVQPPEDRLAVYACRQLVQLADQHVPLG